MEVQMNQAASNTGHHPGDPDIPEERNPQGHDSQSDPSRAPVPMSPSTAPPVQVDVKPTGSASHPTKLDDARFLVEEFNINERKAAAAVLDKEPSAHEVEDLSRALMREQRSDDPLADKPTPEEPAEITIGREGAGHLRNVVHKGNNRAGAG